MAKVRFSFRHGPFEVRMPSRGQEFGSVPGWSLVADETIGRRAHLTACLEESEAVHDDEVVRPVWRVEVWSGGFRLLTVVTFDPVRAQGLCEAFNAELRDDLDDEDDSG